MYVTPRRILPRLTLPLPTAHGGRPQLPQGTTSGRPLYFVPRENPTLPRASNGHRKRLSFPRP